MTLKSIRKALLIAFIFVSVCASAADENIIIQSLVDTYTIVERSGRPETVKNVEKSVFTALRYDADAVAMIGYGGSIAIDKASAPGAKPVYRQWIDGDIFYEDSRICFMEFPVKLDKTAKVEFQRTFRQPEQFDKVMMISNYPVKEYTTEIIVPSSLAAKIDVKPYSFPANAEFTTENLAGGAKKYKAVIKDMPAFKREKQAGSAAIVAPALLVTGVFDGLQGLYGFLKSYLPDDPVDGPVAEFAAGLTAGLDSDMAKADAIASWVRQNIRYVAIEHGEWAIRPDDAAKVFEKRFGDCKGSANLIKAMLRSVGIDGRMCWVGTNGSVPHDWKDFPALCSGNHCIAAAVIGDSTLYYDGTVTYCPPGYIPPSIQRRPVIMENGDAPVYAVIPRLSPSTSTESVEMKLTLDPEKKTLAGDISRTMTGRDRYMLLQVYYSFDMSRRDVFLEKRLSGGAKSVKLSDVTLDHGEPCDLNAVLSGKISDTGAVTGTDKSLYVRLAPGMTLFEPVDTTDRKYPLANSSPFTEKWTASLSIPEGWEVAALPPVQKIDNEWFGLDIVYDYDSETRTVKASSVMTEKGEGCSLDRLHIYNKEAKAVNKALGAWITVKKTEN